MVRPVSMVRPVAIVLRVSMVRPGMGISVVRPGMGIFMVRPDVGIRPWLDATTAGRPSRFGVGPGPLVSVALAYGDGHIDGGPRTDHHLGAMQAHDPVRDTGRDEERRRCHGGHPSENRPGRQAPLHRYLRAAQAAAARPDEQEHPTAACICGPTSTAADAERPYGANLAAIPRNP